MEDTFTLNELQRVYEIIIDDEIVNKSFRRRILGADVIEETGELKETGRRPATLYRKKKLNKTHYFVRNLEGAQR